MPPPALSGVCCERSLPPRACCDRRLPPRAFCSRRPPSAAPSLPQVLLLDEVTVDLDVLARANLMDFLQDECQQRGATVVYVSRVARGTGV